MEKRIKVKVSKKLVSSTTDGVPSGANDLKDSAVSFITAGVAAGDRVHNVTDNVWHTVDAVVDATNIALVTGTIATAKAYIIYSASETIDKYIPTKGAFVASSSAAATTVTYTSAGSTGADVITVAHETDTLYHATTNPVTQFEISLNSAMTESGITPWTKPPYNMTNPGLLIITGVTIG